jgi:hypothetical protein
MTFGGAIYFLAVLCLTLSFNGGYEESFSEFSQSSGVMVWKQLETPPSIRSRKEIV